MAFRCPRCGAVAKTRTSEEMSNITRRSYHQCNNMLCGCTFTTTTTLERYICTPNPPDLSDGFRLPRQAFPSSHYGTDQLTLNL